MLGRVRASTARLPGVAVCSTLCYDLLRLRLLVSLERHRFDGNLLGLLYCIIEDFSASFDPPSPLFCLVGGTLGVADSSFEGTMIA